MLITRITSLILSFAIICTLGCKKNKEVIPDKPDEDSLIKEYITTYSLNAIKDSSGIYYEVIRQGSGEIATIESTVVLNYTAAILNAKPFDSHINTTFRLKNVIRAWQVSIPKIQPGGRIVIYVPSALAYGSNSPKFGIPINSTLVFDIELLSYVK